jgi:hypothetical protein
MNIIRTYLSALVAVVKREPIRTFAVLRSAGAVVVAFWPGLVTPDQTIAILGLGTALFGVDELVRQQVTSVAAPKLEKGTMLTVTTPGPTPDKVIEVR